MQNFYNYENSGLKFLKYTYSFITPLRSQTKMYYYVFLKRVHNSFSSIFIYNLFIYTNMLLPLTFSKSPFQSSQSASHPLATIPLHPTALSLAISPLHVLLIPNHHLLSHTRNNPWKDEMLDNHTQ